jgi:glycosyltransferase involved in cell wall biosynthesis
MVATATHVVTATPFIASQFPADKTTVIHNYPDLTEIRPDSAARSARAHETQRGVYVGSHLDDIRCGPELVAALQIVAETRPGLEFVLAGRLGAGVDPSGLANFRNLGMVDRDEVASLLASGTFGVVLFRRAPNVVDALPTKFFEYCGAGLATIVSSSTRQIAEIGERIGSSIVVDEESPESISAALTWMVDNPEEVAAMGARAAAASPEYSWAPQAEKLIGLYDRLLS